MKSILLATVSWLSRVQNVKFTPSQQTFTASEIEDFEREMNDLVPPKPQDPQQGNSDVRPPPTAPE